MKTKMGVLSKAVDGKLEAFRPPVVALLMNLKKLPLKKRNSNEDGEWFLNIHELRATR